MLHRNTTMFTEHIMANENARILSLRNERAARRLGWTPEAPVTWREFLEQYPYQARAIANDARRELGNEAA
jgi:hypothetical protein